LTLEDQTIHICPPGYTHNAQSQADATAAAPERPYHIIPQPLRKHERSQQLLRTGSPEAYANWLAARHDPLGTRPIREADGQGSGESKAQSRCSAQGQRFRGAGCSTHARWAAATQFGAELVRHGRVHFLGLQAVVFAVGSGGELVGGFLFLLS
jgi:hypothetical protein